MFLAFVQFGGAYRRSTLRTAIVGMAASFCIVPSLLHAADSPGNPPNDLVVQIHYQGGAATFSSWLTLSKIGGDSKVEYRVDDAIVAIPRPTRISPTVPWTAIWDKLAAQGFFELRGDSRDVGCPRNSAQVVDADIITVAIRRGGQSTTFSYSYPPYASCAATKRLVDVLVFLQKAFGNVLPLPKYSEGLY